MAAKLWKRLCDCLWFGDWGSVLLHLWQIGRCDFAVLEELVVRFRRVDDSQVSRSCLFRRSIDDRILND